MATTRKTSTQHKKPGKLTRSATLKAITHKQTATQMIQAVATDNDLTRKQVKAVLVSWSQLMKRHLMKGGCGELSLLPLGIKVQRITKPAMKSRQLRHPRTGKLMKIPAKPKRPGVKVIALKALREMV